jgi:hypothetical protein
VDRDSYHVASGEAKARENRLRRKAAHQRLELRRNKVRDIDAPGYGMYQLWRTSVRGLAKPVGGNVWRTLDEIEAQLTGGQS